MEMRKHLMNWSVYLLAIARIRRGRSIYCRSGISSSSALCLELTTPFIISLRLILPAHTRSAMRGAGASRARQCRLGIPLGHGTGGLDDGCWHSVARGVLCGSADCVGWRLHALDSVGASHATR